MDMPASSLVVFVLCFAEQSTKFSSNLLDATKAFSIVVTDKSELDGLPDSLLQLFSQVFCSKRAIVTPSRSFTTVLTILPYA